MKIDNNNICKILLKKTYNNLEYILYLLIYYVIRDDNINTLDQKINISMLLYYLQSRYNIYDKINDILFFHHIGYVNNLNDIITFNNTTFEYKTDYCLTLISNDIIEYWNNNLSIYEKITNNLHIIYHDNSNIIRILSTLIFLIYLIRKYTISCNDLYCIIDIFNNISIN